MDGIINVDKSSGMTSFDVVRKVKKILKMRKVGHTGTLDPLATGILVICTGRATKLAQSIEGEAKTYVAGFELGYKTTTYDIEGEVVDRSDVLVTREEVEGILEKFRGEIDQVPPMYSALKVDGKRLYELAREGVEIERKSRRVTIDKLELVNFDGRKGTLLCEVSKGTYIRSLIYDIGEELKTFGVMTSLRRTQVGGYDLSTAYTIDEMERMAEAGDMSFHKGVEESFQYPEIELTGEKNIKLFNNGNTVVYRKADGKYRVYSEGKFLGLATIVRNRLKGYKYYNV
ncbi:tRNA pseudouridine synthase B [Propionigenium maris DSM 9537]|uniref:tRNA pseudouridine synthase B n=1 Tax=Propionigenium maris DSM 9537 TaxID=1123000 RepID=A0A9W6LM68_9FUSO|nr:tRNA pseudouridine(55) synthase TruB [Propionigenium maris]GLI55459.1 tRNA pseudouridine synthase B [Propionigenium maris DSM 9537]